MTLSNQNSWENKQEALIASLHTQPLLIVIRPNDNELDDFSSKSLLFSTISKLSKCGVKHIEISWLNDTRWFKLVKSLLDQFPNLLIGVASISNIESINSIGELGIKYAISPVFDENLQEHARKRGQILIPGVLTPTEIQKAKNHGCKIIKLFPASHLGIKYLNKIRVPLDPLPFIIAAGGLKAKDIQSWLNAGYDAIALGRNLVCEGEIDPELVLWLSNTRNN